MLRHSADCTDSQGTACPDEAKVGAAHGSPYVHCSRGGRRLGGEAVREKIQVARAGARDPLGNWEEHDQDESPDDLKGAPPTKALNQADYSGQGHRKRRPACPQTPWLERTGGLHKSENPRDPRPSVRGVRCQALGVTRSSRYLYSTDFLAWAIRCYRPPSASSAGSGVE